MGTVISPDVATVSPRSILRSAACRDERLGRARHALQADATEEAQHEDEQPKGPAVRALHPQYRHQHHRPHQHLILVRPLIVPESAMPARFQTA
jgi:hypothetical protein